MRQRLSMRISRLWQARRFVENVGWPESWAADAEKVGSLDRAAFRKLLEDYKADRPVGDKQHKRQCDVLSRPKSPRTLYGTPVSLMFFEGAPRLQKAGVQRTNRNDPQGGALRAGLHQQEGRSASSPDGRPAGEEPQQVERPGQGRASAAGAEVHLWPPKGAPVARGDARNSTQNSKSRQDRDRKEWIAEGPMDHQRHSGCSINRSDLPLFILVAGVRKQRVQARVTALEILASGPRSTTVKAPPSAP